ncbi:hypothetical protein [Microbacterium sp. NPDC057650]
MTRRATWRPVRTYREHAVAALGAVCGALGISIAVVAVLVLR